MLEEKIASDLKAAMLAADSKRTETLKMAKSAILYKAVELGAREKGLTDDQVIEVLSKEAKKRQEAADMYEKAGRTEQAEAETEELAIITQYLPKQASDEEINTVIEKTISGMEDVSMQQMGQVIGAVKSELGASADGGRVARLVKEKLS